MKNTDTNMTHKIYTTLVFVFLATIELVAGTIKGVIIDKQTGEPLIGATVRLTNNKYYDVAGLDGSFTLKNVPQGAYQLVVNYVAYQEYTQQVVVVTNTISSLTIALEPTITQTLEEVKVVATVDKFSENSARQTERRASQLMNIVSGKAIEVSPDLTVANLVQRVSGVSIERNNNGDGQYAIVRGMDKRYNYTLVNGIKIPSPDNKYRYVPLDIFPSELLARLEVSKTLTPDLEGDAIGGVVNMVMKDAPNQLEIKANLAGGYNELFATRDFLTVNQSSIRSKSPYELFGNTYNATIKDFSTDNLSVNSLRPLPNLTGGLSIGNRFLDNRLGIIVSGNYQHTFRGSNSQFFNTTVYDTELTSRVTSGAMRAYSDEQERLGLHSKIDFKVSANTKVQWYNAFMQFANQQIRETTTTDFSSGGFDAEKGNASLVYSTRVRLTTQQIFNSTLQAEHRMGAKYRANWSLVYSTASNQVPNNVQISVLGKQVAFQGSKTYAQEGYRRWEHNTDQDIAAYLNVTYQHQWRNNPLDISVGGLFRDKNRDNFYNNYILKPKNAFTEYGKDFTDYSAITWNVENPRGAVASALNYEATEQISAAYVMAKLQTPDWQIVTGLRLENTNQGYKMLFPLGELRPNGNQKYIDFLPSINTKYRLSENQYLRASYFRSLNRAGFFEIVPGKIVNEEYQERGNPDLKRAIADNLDIRYELLPNQADQFLVGAFYKKIENPIEYTLQVDDTRGQDVFYMPNNFGTAHNYGIELDFIKTFQHWGIKSNYTYTNSTITTQKIIRTRNANGNLAVQSVNQTRPLFGQSAHVANVSLLYKDAVTGWDGQLSGSYTGERINTVSQFLDNDLWQKAFIQLDFSLEKRIGNRWTIFTKANNLLNTPLEVYLKNTNPANQTIELQAMSGGGTLVRQDYYQRNYLLGLRFNY